MKGHVENIHYGIKIRNFACEQCNLVAATRGQLEIHVKGVHNKTKTIGCMLCDFQTNYRSVLKKHLKATHLNIRELSSGSRDLSYTKKTHGETKEEESNEGCQLCQFVADSEFELLNHLMSTHIVSLETRAQ